MINLPSIFSQIVSLLKKDPIIVVPYLFYAFLSTFLYLKFPYLSKGSSLAVSISVCLISEWYLKAMALIFTVLIAKRLVNDLELEFDDLYMEFKKFFIPILFILFIYVAPQIYLVLRLKGLDDILLFKGDPSYFFMALFFFISITLLLFAPFMVLSGKYTVSQSIIASSRFVKRHRRSVLIYFGLLIVGFFLFVIYDALLSVIPVLHLPIRIIFMGFFSSVKLLFLLFIYEDCCEEGSFSIMI